MFLVSLPNAKHTKIIERSLGNQHLENVWLGYEILVDVIWGDFVLADQGSRETSRFLISS